MGYQISFFKPNFRCILPPWPTQLEWGIRGNQVFLTKNDTGTDGFAIEEDRALQVGLSTQVVKVERKQYFEVI